MTPELLRQYLNVMTDFGIGVGGIVLAGYLILSGQGTENVAGMIGSLAASIQSFRGLGHSRQ